ncbi:hypothetical protein ACLK11_16510 [Escherichia coli]
MIYSGCAQENTGVRAMLLGHTTRRVIRAPAAGIMRSNVKLGDLVKEGDVIAWIGEHEIKAPLTGMVRGLLNDGLAGSVVLNLVISILVVKQLISPAFLIKPGRLAAAYLRR